MDGMLKTLLLGSLLAAVPALATAAPARTVLLLSGYPADPGEAAPGNDYVTIWNDGPVRDEGQAPAALVGKPLQHFVDGRAIGGVHIKRLLSDDNSMCGDAKHLQLAEASQRAGAQLLSTVDLNPGRRYARRTADGDEQRQILQLAQSDSRLLHDVPRATLAPAIAAFARDSHDVDGSRLDIITDGNDPQRRLALLVLAHSEQAKVDGEDSSVSTHALALFAFDGGQWRPRMGSAGHGCDDCDDAPVGYALLDWGDIDGDGLPDLVLQSTGYETYSYYLLLSRNGWALDETPGGC